MQQSIHETLINLMHTLDLGTVTGPITSVAGGFMHRMYKVSTDRGIYAVKHLNPKIMERPDAKDHFARAEKIERILEMREIPIVPAITIQNQKMHYFDGQYFYVFHWLDGHVTDWNHISKDQCRIAGSLLGQLHSICPRNIPHQEPTISSINWKEYSKEAQAQNSKIASLLAENEELFLYAERELNKARLSLPDLLCITDEDMDPKNVMWTGASPKIIDLECLDYGNPISSALQLSLQWSGVTTRDLDLTKMIAFFDGYLEAYDNCYRGYSYVLGLAYTWIEWLEYNIQRALGACSDEEERKTGITQVRETIARIAHICEKEQEIKNALDTQLPPVDPAQYDNHDGRICYYQLMLENDLKAIPCYQLPAGYHFVTYTPNDRDAWIAIEQSAKEFETCEQGLEAWNRYYESVQDQLPGRMYFIETDAGEKVATATAFYDIYGRDTTDGWLHWVAVKREHQGKGLSKPLISHVLHRMKDLGYTHAKIPTQTNTWVACKIYLDFGFLPIPKNLKNSSEGWRMAKALTHHPSLENLI